MIFDESQQCLLSLTVSQQHSVPCERFQLGRDLIFQRLERQMETSLLNLEDGE